MNRIIYNLLLFCMATSQLASTNLNVKMRYNPAIDQLSAIDLKTLYESTIPDDKDNDKCQVLLEKVFKLFSIDTIMQHLLESYSKTYIDVVIWLTDYCGNVSKKSVNWYAQQVFKMLSPYSTVWGANFDKWNLLANKTSNLRTIEPNLMLKIAAINDTDPETWIREDLCPFLQQKSGAVKDIPQSRFRALQSTDFFLWLSKLPGSVKNLSGSVYKKLCRKRNEKISKNLNDKDARLGCSLRQLGYNAPFLDVSLDNFDDESILDIDVYSVFPLLEYLEAIYYIYTIACTYDAYTDYWSKRYAVPRPCFYPNEPERNIVFLVNMREIVFYMVPGEAKPFETLKANTKEILSSLLDGDVTITLDIQPFAYGSSLFDAPYKATGNSYTTSSFTKVIKELLPNH